MRRFGTTIPTSATGNPIARNIAAITAAAIIIQAYFRGQVDRRYAAGLAAFYLMERGGFFGPDRLGGVSGVDLIGR